MDLFEESLRRDATPQGMPLRKRTPRSSNNNPLPVVTSLTVEEQIDFTGPCRASRVRAPVHDGHSTDAGLVEFHLTRMAARPEYLDTERTNILSDGQRATDSAGRPIERGEEPISRRIEYFTPPEVEQLLPHEPLELTEERLPLGVLRARQPSRSIRRCR